MNKKNKNNRKIVENLKSAQLNTYEDKLAVLKYLVKNDSRNISSVLSKTLKSK